ncbi:MAG: hypothetical protein V9H26_08245 [Verrucomicrobiota bacterium]|nr:hypothetical protein [Verrucomicrobiota bacterium]MCC6820827.1 hypothetical protein [Limisphaerales bacterium]
MPIRLNFLAEAQALEEVRRRDPIKRVIWIGVLLVVLMLVWASSLQLQAIIANKDLERVQAIMNSKATAYKQVVDNRKRITETNDKLIALHALATNRFLNGTLLHALQQTTVDDVQLVHLKVDQNYVFVEGAKASTNGSKIVPATPATVTEKIVLSLEGTDASASPGDQVTKFKEALAANAYFRSELSAANQINLKNLSAPQIVPETGRAIVLFTLECRYPQKAR